MEVDGAVVAEQAVLVTVANVETYRDLLPLTPAASPIDGRFDVFVIPRTSKLGLAWRLLRLKLRLPGRWSGVSLYRGRTVVVGSDGGPRDAAGRAARAATAPAPRRGRARSSAVRSSCEEEVPVETVS